MHCHLLMGISSARLWFVDDAVANYRRGGGHVDVTVHIVLVMRM